MFGLLQLMSFDLRNQSSNVKTRRLLKVIAMHPTHPTAGHFPIGLLCVSVSFDALASRRQTGGFRCTTLNTVLAGVMNPAFGV